MPVPGVKTRRAWVQITARRQLQTVGAGLTAPARIHIKVLDLRLVWARPAYLRPQR